jgi:Tol biopolymer transport system component
MKKKPADRIVQGPREAVVQARGEKVSGLKLRIPRRAIVFGATATAGLGILASSIALATEAADVGGSKMLTIALPDFVTDSANLADIALGMTRLIADDLKSAGRFAFPDPSAWTGITINVDAVPAFDVWSALGVQILIIGSITTAGARLRPEVRSWHVERRQALTGQMYFSQMQDWQKAGHGISAAIKESLPG